jgi:FkbM family methyltransferase
MSRVKEAFALLGHVCRHPRNRSWPLRGIVRFFAWQAWKKLVGRPVTVKVGDHRKFLAVPDSHFSSEVIYTGLPEWDEMNFLLRYLRPDDRFLDLGANVGFYTVLASTVIERGEIIAVEASPRNVEILQRQVAINALANVRVIASAVGKIDGTVRFATAQREMGSIVEDDAAGTVELPCRTLDTLLAPELAAGASIALAKMDVEGCEMLILEGAPLVLERGLVRAWIFEVGDEALRVHGYSADELLETFRGTGYALFFWDETKRELHPFTGGPCPSNLIASLDAANMNQRLGLA